MPPPLFLIAKARRSYSRGIAACKVIHARIEQTLPKHVAKNTFLPFHPGAARYYRDVGIKIPDSLVSKLKSIRRCR